MRDKKKILNVAVISKHSNSSVPHFLKNIFKEHKLNIANIQNWQLIYEKEHFKLDREVMEYFRDGTIDAAIFEISNREFIDNEYSNFDFDLVILMDAIENLNRSIKKALIVDSNTFLDNVSDIYRFSADEDYLANFNFKNLLHHDDRTSFDIISEKESLLIDMNTRSKTQCVEASIAAASAMILGLNGNKIISALNKSKIAIRKFEKIYDGRFKIYDDSSSDPQSIRDTLDEISYLENISDVYILYSIYGSKGEELNRLNTKALCDKIKEHNFKFLLVTDSIEITSVEENVTQQERMAVREILKSNSVRYQHFYDLTSALIKLSYLLQEDDVALILGGDNLNFALNILSDKFIMMSDSLNKDLFCESLKRRS